MRQPDGKVYSNENFPLPVVEALLELQHDVLTTQGAGLARQAMPDEAVLAFVHAAGRVLLILNRKHFIRLHREGAAHAGIVACTLDVDFAGLAQRIHEAVVAQDDFVGQLIRINRPQK